MTASAGRRLRRGRGSDPADLQQVMRALIRQIQSPARVIELYYWSQEPKLCEIIRSLVAMRPETRDALGAFLSIASNAAAIDASVDASGRLVLSSQEVTETTSSLGELGPHSPSHRTH
jgi:hypothetical protein